MDMSHRNPAFSSTQGPFWTTQLVEGMGGTWIFGLESWDHEEHISMDLWGVEDWITATVAMVVIVASGFSWSCGRSSTMSPSSTCTIEF